MKIKNQEIVVNVLNKNRKVVKTWTKQNRIVDNFLDWALYHQLKGSQAGSTFAKYSNLDGGAPLYNQLNKKGVEQCYIKFTTKDVITDASTNFNFDLKDTGGGSIYYDNFSGDGLIANATSSYEFEIDATYDNELLTQIGFGLFDIDASASPFNDYLTAWIDVDLLGIRIPEGFILQVQRKDYATNEKIVGSSLGAMYILQEQAKIDKIQLTDINGSIIEEKEIEDLTITNTGIGEIELSGFKNYAFSTSALYPSDTLYPSNSLVPLSGNLKTIKIFMEWINLTTQNDFTIEFNAKDLDVTYDGDTITIKLIIERGDI